MRKGEAGEVALVLVERPWGGAVLDFLPVKVREARLRAGLSQYELADRDRAVIARWEQGVVSPSLETLLEILHACGFDLPLELVGHAPEVDPRLRENLVLSPERRLERLEGADSAGRAKAPRPALRPVRAPAALERHRVAYVVIGGLARVIQGAEETPRRLDITPSTRPENLRRLIQALADLGAERLAGRPLVVDGAVLADEPVIELRTTAGELKLVPEPAGTRRGYDDLRKAATQEPIGRGLRLLFASLGDLARMLAALGHAEDVPKLRQLRQLQELERDVGRELMR